MDFRSLSVGLSAKKAKSVITESHIGNEAFAESGPPKEFRVQFRRAKKMTRPKALRLNLWLDGRGPDETLIEADLQAHIIDEIETSQDGAWYSFSMFFAPIVSESFLIHKVQDVLMHKGSVMQKTKTR